ncbi:helix-turn-helix domain-containing protein [Kribbella sp. NPDC051952]|uniref:helix-turn-helix domain-containing protein n=1 Tax=Kribbella sp. NPDC051952 TaxID=3154851 RepID=UPI003425B632
MPHFRSQETVDSALRMSDEGVSDRENAEIHGVAIKTIRRWRRLYQRRGLPRGTGFQGTPCPRCDDAELDEAAYALLLGWYLGDGCIARARRGVFTLQIINDLRYVRLNQEIADTIKRVKPNASPCRREGGGAVRIEARWKHWPCLFPQHGAGRKHLRRIELMDWQREIVAKYPEQLLRGLFHSDGSRFLNWAGKADGRRYYYPRYMFSNESDDIRQILTDALDLLGIAWRRSRRSVIAVSRKEAVGALDGFVGPKS